MQSNADALAALVCWIQLIYEDSICGIKVWGGLSIDIINTS